jgi:hypothetical protein
MCRWDSWRGRWIKTSVMCIEAAIIRQFSLINLLRLRNLIVDDFFLSIAFCACGFYSHFIRSGLLLTCQLLIRWSFMAWLEFLPICLTHWDFFFKSRYLGCTILAIFASVDDWELASIRIEIPPMLCSSISFQLQDERRGYPITEWALFACDKLCLGWDDDWHLVSKLWSYRFNLNTIDVALCMSATENNH